MPSLRCINVQGWEPADDGIPDLVHIDLASISDTQKRNAQTFTTCTTATTFRGDSNRWMDGTRRQISLERTSTMPHPTTLSRSAMQRHYSSTLPAPPPAGTRSLTSSRSAAAAGRAVRPRSSTERKIARKRAENANYIPRPRNSFIIFRTEFVNRKTNGEGERPPSKRRHDDSDDERSLSKQAAEVWQRMSDAEKQPWIERAEQEKREHAAMYPHYRYRPIRQNAQRKSISTSRSSTSDASAAPMLVDNQATLDEALPKAVDELHLFSVSESPSSAMPELRMPAPVSATFSPSSLSLANTLATPPESPTVNHCSVAVPFVPRVPRVPVLNPPLERPMLRHDKTLPAIPRSPSAPTFMQAQMQPMLFGGTVTSSNSVAESTHLRVARGPGIRRVSCPPKPQFNLLGQPEAPKATEATLPVADVHMGAPSPLSVGGSDTTGLEYFPEFIQPDDKGTDEYLSLFAQDLAGPAALTSWQSVPEFMTKNDDECNTRTDTTFNVNMRALLPPVIEEAELPFSIPSGVTPQDHQPLEAVAALWSQGVGGASDSNVTTPYESSVATETSTKNDSASPMTAAFSDADGPLYDFGLGTYNCAFSDFLIPSPDSAARATQCGAPITDFDMLQLSRDLESELSCASVLPASTLSFSALCGF